MNQSFEDGVLMENTVFMIDEKKQGFPLSTRIFQFLVIAIGTWSSISVLIECLNIPCNIVRVTAAILVIVGAIFSLCLLPSYEMVKLFFGFLFYGLFFFSRLPRILNAFYIVENTVLSRMSIYYGTDNLRFKANYTSAEADTTLLVILVIIPVVFLLGLAIVKNRLVGLSGLVLFLPVSASFALGLIPSERYLITYVVCVLYLTRSAYHFHHITDRQQRVLLHRISSKAAIWLSFISILILFLMKLFLTQEAYNNETNIKDMKTEIQTAMQNFSMEEFMERISEIKLFTRKVSSTGLNGGDLGKTGQVQYLNSKHLTLTAPIQSIEEGIYLKGYVGSVYTGDKWEGHSEETQEEYLQLLQDLPIEIFPTVNQVNRFLNHFLVEGTLADSSSSTGWNDYSMYRGVMEIKYAAANKKYLYAPYFTDYDLMPEITYEQDLYASPIVKEDNYKYNFYFNVTLWDSPRSFYENLWEKLSDYTDYEKRYRNFVYKTYTTLPEEGLQNIKREFSPDRVKINPGDVIGKIKFVRDYMDQNTQYSLSPGKLPEGKDFVEHFLFENRLGYCAHYASAATLMLRTMGVPARYIEGYAVGEESIKRNSGLQEIARHTNLGTNTTVVTVAEVNVMDYNAHAWVEVYFDNCGWIPVEFTPGSTVNYNDSVVEDMDQFTNNMEHENNKNSQEQDTPEPLPTIPVFEQDQMQDNTNVLEEEAGAGSKTNAIAGNLLFFAVIGGALAILGTVLLLRRVNNTNKARHARNHNKRAIFLFSDIEKMLITSRSLPRKGAMLEESEVYIKEHCTYIEEEGFNHLMDIIRKARFGRGHISYQELKVVIQFRNLLYHKVTKDMSLPRRIFLKLQLSVL